MMKRPILLLMLLCMTSLVAHAALSSNQRAVGYSTTDDITIKGAAFGEAGTYSIGALLSAKSLSPYVGCRIVGIRIAAGMALGRARTFIYKADGSQVGDLVIEQKQKLYEDWNEVFFNGDGIEINDGDNLFYGFDYVETAEMVAAEQGGICGVGEDTNGAFYINQEQTLYQISGAGMLCVQLIVDISNLPLHDIDITYLDTGFKYKKQGETVSCFASFTNTGREALNSWQVGYQLDDQQPVLKTYDEPLKEGQEESWEFDIQIPADMTIGKHQIKVFTCQAEGEALPELSRNDTMSASFAVYNETLERRNKVYMEVYTDQSSPYVPYLNDAITELVKNSDVAVANIHRPETPLAIDGAAYLHELYAYTWPTFTVNRAYYPGEAYIAYDMNDYLPVIGTEMTVGIINSMLIPDLQSPSFASVDVKATFDADSRQLTVTASGSLLPDAKSIYGDMALTLLLVEDGVKGAQAVYNNMTGKTTVNNNYLHNQVLRSYLTEPTGDLIEVTDNSFTTERSLTLDADWKADKMTVIALLTKYADNVTDDNVLDMDVINCNTATVSATQGIHSISATIPTDSDIIYDMQGRPIAKGAWSMVKSQLPKGLYIVNGKKVAR